MRMCSHHPTRCGRKMGILLVFLVLVLSSAAFAAGPLPGESAHPLRPATSSRSVEELRAPRGDVRTPAPSEEAVKARLAEDYGTFPLLFEQSTPTEDSPVHFTVRGRDKTLYFTPEGITFSLSMPETEAPAEKASASAAPSGPSREDRVGALRAEAPRGRWTLKLDFVGAAPVRPEGETKANTVISYFKGKSSEHRTVPTYRRIVYRNLWPGIDLQYAGDTNHLKYQFVVHPGADPAHIRLAYRGAERLAPGSDGGLEIVTAAGTLRDDTPVSWQEVDGARVPVTVTYALGEGANPRNYGFAVAPYDRTKPLIIDPVVFIYCGYIGGAKDDFGRSIAVDGAGCAYVTGRTDTAEYSFPVKVGPDLTYNGGADYYGGDAFVAKVAADGKSLVYCGYIGGIDDDYGNGIAVDGAGCAYVTGDTSSTETTFPVKEGPDLAYNGGIDDAFVAKVAASGEELAFCGYIGGAGSDKGLGIALDGLGNAYMTGVTTSTQDTFPVMGGLGTTYAGGNNDAFVAKVGIALACRASLQGHGAGLHAASLAVRLRPAAGGEETTATVFSNREGAFALSPSDGGEWRVVAKERRTLSAVRIGTPGGAVVDFGALRAGDANSDDQVTILDVSLLAATFGKTTEGAGYDDRADFNGDGVISIVDFSLLASNFGAVGEILGGAGAAKPSASASAPAASAGTSLTAEGSKGGCALGVETALPLLLLPAVFLILRGKR